jgi:hypothetical protein
MSIATASTAFSCSGSNFVEVAVEAGLAAFVGDVLDHATFQVGDHSHVVLAPARRLLIDAEVNWHLDRLRPQPALHGSLHQVPGLVPAQPQQASRAQHVTLLEDVHRQPLEQSREA